MTDKEKILITGIAGFIGSNLAEYFLKDGYDVCGIDNFSPYYSTKIKEKNARYIESLGGTIYRLDIVDGGLNKVFDDYDFVIHCAAQPGIDVNTKKEDYEKNNTLATKNILDLSRKMDKLKCFINISSSSVYGISAIGSEESETKPFSDYGRTKLEAERLALKYNEEKNVPCLSVRLFSVYGERERPDKLLPKLINSAINNQEFPLYEGSLDHFRSYTYVGDVMKGISNIIDNYDKCIGEILNLGSEEAHKTSECIEMVEKIMNKKIKIKTLEKRAGDQLLTKADTRKIKRILNYVPKTSLEEGIKKQISWFSKERI